MIDHTLLLMALWLAEILEDMVVIMTDVGIYEQNPGHKCAALVVGRESDYFEDEYK